MKVNTQNVQNAGDIKGKPEPCPGFYHFTITSVNDARVKADGKPLNATIFELEVLTGTVPGQEGKAFALWVNLTQNGEEDAQYMAWCSRLALACQLIGGNQPETEITAELFDGCQFIGEIREYTKDNQTKRTMRQYEELLVWSLDEAVVSSVPRNHDAIRLWNEARGVTHQGNGHAAGGNGNGHHAGATVGAGVNTDDI